MPLKPNHLTGIISASLLSLSIQAYASTPVWTFTPLTPTTITVTAGSTATVQYTVSNQSKKPHTLAMKGITGISQVTTVGNCSNPFSLEPKGSSKDSCVLTLTVNGSALQANVKGGPIVCQANPDGSPNSNQCYQPSEANSLNITRSETPGSATLSASVTALALSVNCPTQVGSCTRGNAALTGTPRQITITNTSLSNTALNVTYNPSPALPSGTTIAPSSCGNIAPNGGTCVLLITPGQTSSATPGAASNPSTLTITGSNTNILTPTVEVLTYGNQYQDGYVFAVDDTTQTTGSIGGKVASLTDESGAIIWSSNGTAGSVSYDIIPWIGETSSSNTTYSNAQSVFDTTYSNAGTGPGRFPFPPQSSFDTTCDGATQGACNSGNILALYNTYITNYGGTYILAPGQTSLNQYAAGLCSALSDGWYLPAICEMGYGSSECGTKLSPTLQNMQSNLVDAGNIGGLTSGGSAGFYWSSTEGSGNSQNFAWGQRFASGGGFQNGGDKGNQLGVRCARALTP